MRWTIAALDKYWNFANFALDTKSAWTKAFFWTMGTCLVCMYLGCMWACWKQEIQQIELASGIPLLEEHFC